MAILEEVIHETTIAISHFVDSRYLAVASYAAMLYDHLITYDVEVSAVWMKPLNLVSVLFLFNRYTVPIFIAINMYDKGGGAQYISDTLYVAISRIPSSNANHMPQLLTHALVALRVSALWGKNYVLKIIISVLFVLYLIATLVVATFVGKQSSPSFHFDKTMHMCIGEISEEAFWTWVPALLFESVLFALTIVKAIHYRRSSFSMHVAQTLYRDGIIYFIVIALCTIFNVIAWTVLPSSFVGLAKYSTFSLVNMTGSRMIINLRSLNKVEDDDSHSQNVSGHEMGDFNSGKRARLGGGVQVYSPNAQVISVPLRSRSPCEEVASPRMREVKWLDADDGWNGHGVNQDTSRIETFVTVTVDIERSVE
ncbi:hypothetical protein FRC02_010711 [Tulasnella sp. 418]|nr:hypothetical protein FRC02_010711 [Tulasnella sp. 418]